MTITQKTTKVILMTIISSDEDVGEDHDVGEMYSGANDKNGDNDIYIINDNDETAVGM